MDYEKKYNEALERARKYMDDGYTVLMPDLVPDLRESEDERIRKAIEDIIHVYEKTQGEWIAGYDIDTLVVHLRDAFAYLEKQKEKPADAKSERVIKAASRVLNNWLYGDMSADVSGDFTELEDSIREYDGEEKQKEQKPAQSEDEKIRKEIIHYILYKANDVSEEQEHAWISYLEKWKEYVSDNFDDVWTTEDCTGIIEAGEKLSPRFKELLKKVCHAWYDKGIELVKRKEQKPNIELIQKSWYMEGYHDCEFGYEPKWIIKTGEGGPRYEENPKYGQIIEQKPVEWSEDFDKEVEDIHKRYPEVSFAKLTRIAYHFSKWANRRKDMEWREQSEKRK